MDREELDLLIEQLETRNDLSIAEHDAVVGALAFLLGDRMPTELASPTRISTTDGAMLVADAVYPDWAVHIRGRANDRDGHWRCILREDDTRDSDKAIGSGRSPVLGQSILAAVLRLSMILSK